MNVQRQCPDEENIEWVWNDDTCSFVTRILNNCKDVLFHPERDAFKSCKRGVVRGTEPMMKDQYFWEIKMLYYYYGSEIMIGVGTSEYNVSILHDKFFVALGTNDKTWGLSSTGLFHHSDQSRTYSPRFTTGSIIGVHLDMWHGTLSYYINQKYLGVASSGLKGKTLFPMASSTSANTRLSIMRSTSFPTSLQFLCCKKLRDVIPQDKNVLDVVEFPPGLRQFLGNNFGWFLNARHMEGEIYDDSDHSQDQISILNALRLFCYDRLVEKWGNDPCADSLFSVKQ